MKFSIVSVRLLKHMLALLLSCPLIVLLYLPPSQVVPFSVIMAKVVKSRRKVVTVFFTVILVVIVAYL